MRLLPALLALFAAATAAEAPPHLKGMPEGVLHRGPAPTALEAVGEGGRTRLWLPGGERTFEVERVVRGRTTTTRFGRIPGVGSAAVTLGPDGGFGQITQGATLWLLEYRDGAAWALRAGEGGLPFAPDDEGALTAPDAAPAPKGAPGGAWSGAAVRTVDFAGLYDTDFAARYPGALAATRIEFLVALTNQAFVDSDVRITLRTVHTQVVPGPVSPSALDNVYDLFLATTGGTFGGVDLRALRARTGADLVSFLRPHDLYAREVCGVAYFPLDLRTGVSVVIDGESGGSICRPSTFAHEIGHNFGARHQLSADSSIARGHAFHRPGQFHTLMASLGSGKPDRFLTLNYYSNPRIACGNLPCGRDPEPLICLNPPCGLGPGEDNAGAMNENAALVAGYLPTGVAGDAARPAPTLADSDGDGLIDRIDAFPFEAARTVDRDGDGRADQDDVFPDNSTEWLDSDGGGLGDNADTDDDNDGVADGADKFPLDPLEAVDADNDGYGDAGDAFDADPREQRDTDGDGIGDRADDDDDADGTVDVAPLAAAADGELLVADAATQRILRFQGSDYAPLGTLLQLGPVDVTFRSGIAAAPSGELYFVTRNEFRTLDRLRSTTPELMLNPGAHPQIGTGFPLSPIILPTGDVMLGEMGVHALLTLRPAPSRAPTPLVRVFFPPDTGAPHLRLLSNDHIAVLDGVSGALRRYLHGGDPMLANPATQQAYGTAVPELSSGDTALGPGGLLYWVDRRDGAVRSLDPATGATGAFAIATADAAAIDVSPDGILVVAQRSGGVRAYDAASAADLGLVIPAASAAQPLQLAWVPRIVDTDLPPIVPPAPPAPTLDPATTPAVDSARPPPPPCTTDCISSRQGAGSGGAFAAGLALLLGLLALRRRAANAP